MYVTPTPTATVSATVTPTVTPTISFTPTITASITPSITASITPTRTGTPAVRPTGTPAVTPTRTIAPTATPPVTPTATPPVTPTRTRTGTPTPPVQLLSASASSVRPNGQVSTAGIRLNNTGTFQTISSQNGTATPFNWLLSGSAGSYDAYATYSGSGSITGAALNTWLNLGTSRAWNLTVTTNNTEHVGNLQIQIRPAGGGATLVTNTYYISAVRGTPQ